MINTQRIVPIQKVDFLTLIGTVMTLANVSYSVLASSDIDGDFTVTGLRISPSKALTLLTA